MGHVTMLHDCQNHTDRTGSANKPVRNTKNKTYQLIDPLISCCQNMTPKETENYRNLQIEIIRVGLKNYAYYNYYSSGCNAKTLGKKLSRLTGEAKVFKIQDIVLIEIVQLFYKGVIGTTCMKNLLLKMLEQNIKSGRVPRIFQFNNNIK